MPRRKTIPVNDPMAPADWKYDHYDLSAPEGDFSEWQQLVGWHPNQSPADMLHKGVFEGKYLNDQRKEFPRQWFDELPSTIPRTRDIQRNFFHVQSRQPLRVWKDKGWIRYPDARGWFQWYCRYYYGRRIPELDTWQIRRWHSFVKRHLAQVRKHCGGCGKCRPRQRQGLLQWGWFEPQTACAH